MPDVAARSESSEAKSACETQRSGARRTVVIGCGVIGLTTGLELLRRGEQVLLVDGAEQEGVGTSFANGGLLTPSMPDPWNAPGIHRHLLEYLVSSSSALKVRLKALPSLALWGPKFLLNSRQAPYQAATRANFSLADYSLSVMRELRSEYDLAFDALDHGTLKIFRSEGAWAAALSVSQSLKPLGLVADPVETVALPRIEPCLTPIAGQLAGGIFYPSDGSGDAHIFCRAIARTIRNLGGSFRFGTPVRTIEVVDGQVRGIWVGKELVEADGVVIATGVASPALAARFGTKLAIKPVKGYSVTYDVGSANCRPRVPVIDDAFHAAITPLGSRLRAAGTAEFAGHDLRLDRKRLDNLSLLFSEVYPELASAATLATAKPWAGLRPVAADGLPYIGAAPVKGLWINSGHGHLGWTLAAGGARMLVDLMAGVKPAIDAAPFAPSR